VSKNSDIKDALKQPDTFVSTSHVVLKFVEDHAKIFGTLVLVASIGGIAYVSHSFWRNQVEAKAAERLYKLEAELKKAEGKIREERAKKMQEMAGLTAGKKKDVKIDEPRPVDFAKDFAGIVGNLKAELKNVSGTRAAVVSALNLSSFLVQQKQYQEALEVLKSPDVKPAATDLLGGFWRMHYGLVLIENNKADEALALYQEVLATDTLKAFHPEALLKLGIAFEVKGDSPKARETYEKLGRDYPGTEASAAATQYMRLLDLKTRGQG
jgi:TolA-binding protein